MKLAFCLNKYFPYGGLQRDFLRIARICQQRGHEIHIYTMRWDAQPEPGMHLHLIEPNGWQNHTRIRSFARKVKAQLDKEHFNLVVGFNKMPGLDVYYAADVCYQSRVQAMRSLLHRLLPRYRQLIAFEHAVFARGGKTEIMLISSLQLPEFINCYQTERERFHLLPPGISKDRIAPPNAGEIREAMRKSLQLTADDVLLLMVGSGFQTKGLDRAIHALASLPDALKQRCHLFVIGQDNPDAFVRLAKQLRVNDRLYFLGGRSDVPNFLLAADLLLHPAYYENTGTVLLEAMVSGLPVLTVDRCGYAQFIKDAQSGKVLPSPFQQEIFNTALQEMIQSGNRQQWQSNALAFATQADIYSLPEKAADLIEAIAQKRLAEFPFDLMMSMQGECFRHQEGRLTQRVHLHGKDYFIKQHKGVGWKEIVKNLLQFRLPVISAKNEWLAIDKLQALNVAVPKIAAFEQRGVNPARRKSYILLEELTSVVSLEDLSKTWLQTPPAFNFKNKLITEVARIASTLHTHGVNHRDFYICHFLLDTSTLTPGDCKLYLIDLHRAQIRHLTPERWIIKDLAGLYFSSKEIGLTQRDLYRFMRIYHGKPLREIVKQERNFWQKVKKRGEQLYREHTG